MFSRIDCWSSGMSIRTCDRTGIYSWRNLLNMASYNLSTPVWLASATDKTRTLVAYAATFLLFFSYVTINGSALQCLLETIYMELWFRFCSGHAGDTCLFSSRRDVAMLFTFPCRDKLTDPIPYVLLALLLLLNLLPERQFLASVPDPFKEDITLAYYNVDRSEPMCVWKALISLGYSKMDLIHAGFYPWTTSFSRVDLSIFQGRQVLPLHYRLGTTALGHVSCEPFPGSTFGFNVNNFRLHNFGQEETPSSSYYSPPIGALGGVKQMLTQIPVLTRSSNFDKHWDYSVIPDRMAQMQLRLRFMPASDSVYSLRQNQYTRHFPKGAATQRLPQYFTDDTQSEFLWRYNNAANRNHLVNVSSSGLWTPHSIGVRALHESRHAIHPLLNGSTGFDDTRAAQNAMSSMRFLSTRGNRTIPGWEAADVTRGASLANYLANASQVQDYRTIAVRLWMRYFQAVLLEEFNSHQRAFGGQQFTLVPQQTGVNTNVVWLDAAVPAPPVPAPGAPAVPPANPEAAFWDPIQQGMVLNGESQILDSVGFSDGEMSEYLSAVDPMVAANVPYFRQAPLPDFPRLNGCGRYIFNQAVNTIFIHNGNQPRQNQAAILAGVHRAPVAADILSVIRILAVTQNASEDMIFGRDVAISRLCTIRLGDLGGRRDNAQDDVHVNGDGHYTLDLPRTYTPAAYFSCFFHPAPMTDELHNSIRMRPRAIIHHAALLTHFRATALGWAAYASSMYGRIWENLPGAEADPRIRNHMDHLQRKFGLDTTSLWSGIAANAMAHQYGFSLRPDVRATENGLLVNQFQRYTTPNYTNHYHELWAVDFMPDYQVLPYHDPEQHWSKVRIPLDESKPIPDDYGLDDRVRLFREKEPFKGHAWVSDGGYTYNGQFYVAQANNAGLYRFENGQRAITLSRWNAQHTYQVPNAPANQAIQHMGALNTEFADFIQPGSMLCFNVSRGTQHVFAVHSTDAANLALLSRWRDLTTGLDERSLMVNYIHPLRQQRDIDDLPDYSAVLWSRANAFAGVTIAQHSLPNFDVDARFDDSAAMIRAPLVSSTVHGDPAAATPTSGRINSTRYTSNHNAANANRRALAAPGSERAHVTQIQYKSKNPLVTSELPPSMVKHAAHAEHDGVTYGPTTQLSDAPDTPMPQPGYVDEYDAKLQDYEDMLHNEAAHGQKAIDADAARDAELAQDFSDYLRLSRERRERQAQRATQSQTLPASAYSPKRKPTVKLPPTQNPKMATPQFDNNIQNAPPVSPDASQSAAQLKEAMPNYFRDKTNARIRPGNDSQLLGHLPKSKNVRFESPVEPNDSAAANAQVNAGLQASRHNPANQASNAPGDTRNDVLSNPGAPPPVNIKPNTSGDERLTAEQGEALAENLRVANQPKN